MDIQLQNQSINSKNIIGRVNSIKKLIEFINKNNEGENYGRKFFKIKC